MDAVENFRSTLSQRLSKYPENGYYRAGKDQLAIIEQDIAQNGSLSQETYDSITLGVMCAREVEQIDMSFCEAAYAMLEEVKPKLA